MGYFSHEYASNSDLKKLMSRHLGRPPIGNNLDEIFRFGTGFHEGITEPHKVDFSEFTTEQADLIKAMRKTFWKDQMCREIVMMPDFRREHEFYRANRFGITARCKTDGDSKKLRVILELKSLSVTSEKQFLESIDFLDYDQGAAWYLNVASSASPRGFKYEQELIVGISKKDPERLFKLLIRRDDKYYRHGLTKVKKAVEIWKMYGLK